MLYTIYAESTPNPEVMKFVANQILTNEIIEVNSLEEAKEIKIAKSLFNFPFVTAVFISANFISITKTQETKWEDMAIQLRTFIADFLNEHGIDIENKNPNIEKQKKIDKSTHTVSEFNDEEKEIVEVLNQYIQPAIEADGGAISLKSFKNGIVKVILKGACNGCPSSIITLKQGIESLLKEKIGDKIKEVSAD